MERRFDVIILGAGAAGMTAAAVCARKLGKGRVALLEKQKRPARKLLATGNGRCNISNLDISEKHYRGNAEIIRSVIGSFPRAGMKKFCNSLGLLLREEDCRLYPLSNSSATVSDRLRYELEITGAELFCECEISSVRHQGKLFRINTSTGDFLCSSLVFACGSPASPSLGSDNSGFTLLESLDISHSSLFPALSPVQTKEKYPVLKGVRAKGSASLYADDKLFAAETGEIQFSDKSLSGICIFQLSRYVNEFLGYGTINGGRFVNISLSVDLMPDHSIDDICSYLRKMRSTFKNKPAAEILSAALNKKLCEALISFSGLKGRYCHELSENDIRRLGNAVKAMKFTPEYSDQFPNAQVCAGGVGADELFTDSLMSRRHKGLYIIGEMLDADGECGGFNLHFAVGSAMLAAKNIIKQGAGI